MMEPSEQEIIKELNLLMHPVQVQTDIQSQLSMQEHLDIIIQLLSERIRQWLDHDFEHLLRLMYRLDVREGDFHNALASDKPATQLARLILGRELQKAKTRILYRKDKL